MDDKSNPDAEAADDGLKQRLINRIIVAALIVVGLLGSLAMFEEIYTPPRPPVKARLAVPPGVEPEPKPKLVMPAPETAPEPAVVEKPAEKPAGNPVPEHTAAPATPLPKASPAATAQRAPASRPVMQAVERRYALQVGVFGNVANAEDLRAKLVAHGIPATIEARVHVGPFITRQEVDVARAKLKELGLDEALLLTTKK